LGFINEIHSETLPHYCHYRLALMRARD
jgi:hypothetical protein